MTGTKAAGIAARALWNARAAAATRQLVGSLDPDIVHVHKLYPQLSVAPVVVASRMGIPIVQTVHDYEFISASPFDDAGSWRDCVEKQLSYRTLNTLLFQAKHLIHSPRVNSWISVSRSTCQAYRERGITATVLPNFTEPFTGRVPSFDDRRGILFMGRLSEEKGLRHVLELPRHLSSEIPVTLAGEGPLRDEVRLATEAFPCVTYLGKLDREGVARQLASARVVIMPSLWREPGPLAALEAMAAGTPLIVYDNGGLAEYVANAAAGIIVTSSVTLMANAITSLYDDRERWEKFSSSARDAIQRDHTLQVYLDRLEGIYSDSIDAA
jgi:glycosyltransferase involved in cell wall biosynthesis